MFILGLTGSIGMGKSTTAQLFRDEGVPVYDADAAVHELYESDAVAPIEAAFPGTTAGGMVDRVKLSQQVIGHLEAMKKLEAIVHPLVRKAEQHFLQAAARNGAKIAVLDIPLLFETGGERRVHAVLVVTAPHEVQRQRVLERPGMTEAKLEAILAKQMLDADKRRRADFIVDTGHGLDHARRQVRQILAQIAKMPPPDSKS